MANVNIKLTGDVKNIILNAAVKRLNSCISRALPDIGIGTRKVCEVAIKSAIEYNSLISGDLRAQFGLIDIRSILDGLIGSMLAELYLDWKPLANRSGNITGGLGISVVKKDMSNILNQYGASYTSNGFDIPWLQWLLKEGNEPVVFNYFISFKLKPEEILRSRSGRALMRPDLGSSWAVPDRYAGTEDDNWITRSLAYAVAPTQQVVENALTEHIK